MKLNTGWSELGVEVVLMPGPRLDVLRDAASASAIHECNKQAMPMGNGHSPHTAYLTDIINRQLSQ
jgi:hypothetical protein